LFVLFVEIHTLWLLTPIVCAFAS